MRPLLEKIKAKIANLNFRNTLYSVKNYTFVLIHKRPSKKLVFVSALLVIIVAGLFFVIRRTRRNLSTMGANGQVQITNPKATEILNKEFDFPLKDSTGKEVSKFKYIIESVDLRDEIVVKGQKATAIQGKIFLIINLKIVNEHNQGVQINTKDYVRLSLNGNKTEWLASDFHNDPVEIQAISTKQTRLGFAVNNSDKNPLLRIGEINGEKIELPIKFN